MLEFIGQIPRLFTGLKEDSSREEHLEWFRKLGIQNVYMSIIFSYLLSTFNHFQVPVIAVLVYGFIMDIFGFHNNLRNAYPESSFEIHSSKEIDEGVCKEWDEFLELGSPFTREALSKNESTDVIYTSLIKDGMFHGLASLYVSIMQHATRSQSRVLFGFYRYAVFMNRPFSPVEKRVSLVNNEIPSMKSSIPDNSGTPIIFDFARPEDGSIYFTSFEQKSNVNNFLKEISKDRNTNIIHVRDHLYYDALDSSVRRFFERYESMNNGNVFFLIPRAENIVPSQVPVHNPTSNYLNIFSSCIPSTSTPSSTDSVIIGNIPGSSYSSLTHTPIPSTSNSSFPTPIPVSSDSSAPDSSDSSASVSSTSPTAVVNDLMNILSTFRYSSLSPADLETFINNISKVVT